MACESGLVVYPRMPNFNLNGICCCQNTTILTDFFIFMGSDIKKKHIWVFSFHCLLISQISLWLVYMVTHNYISPICHKNSIKFWTLGDYCTYPLYQLWTNSASESTKFHPDWFTALLLGVKKPQTRLYFQLQHWIIQTVKCVNYKQQYNNMRTISIFNCLKNKVIRTNWISKNCNKQNTEKQRSNCFTSH